MWPCDTMLMVDPVLGASNLFPEGRRPGTGPAVAAPVWWHVCQKKGLVFWGSFSYVLVMSMSRACWGEVSVMCGDGAVMF